MSLDKQSFQQGTAAPVIMLLCAATFWGVLWYPLRLLAEAGLDGLWTTWVIFATAAVPGAVLAWAKRGELLEQPGLLLLIALTSGWLNTAFVLAVLDGNVVRVILLFYLSPLWSTLLGWWWLGERPSLFGWFTLVLAMLGALFILWNSSLGFPWPQGAPDWLAISSGLGFSLSNALVRRTQHLSVRLKAGVAWWGVVLVSGTWLLFAGIPWPSVTATTWLGAIALGAFGIFFMTLAVVYGVGKMPLHRSAVILLFEVLAGAISSQILTNERLLPIEWLGGGLIVAAAWLSARQGEAQQT